MKTAHPRSFVARLTALALMASGANLAAQAPSSIGGRTIELVIESGSGPFAANGTYRFLPSAIDTGYAIVPVAGNIAASSGNYFYTTTGVPTAELQFDDSLLGGGFVANCTFTSPTTGTYRITNAGAPGASQQGTYTLFAGQAPASIAGATVNITVTSGTPPYAASGSRLFLPSPDGTYKIVGVGWGEANTSGTYTYKVNSPTTAIVTLSDSQFGLGQTQQLSFKDATSGTYFLQHKWPGGFQTGTFVYTPKPPAILIQPQSQMAEVGANVTFNVTADGFAPLGYQWSFGGIALSAATNASLILTNVQLLNSGSYVVVVSNSVGSVTSRAAVLTVRNATLVGGTIQGSVMWTQTSRNYLLTNDMEIPFGAELGIAPGVIVDGSGQKMWVGGNLYAIGTKNAMIHFRNLAIQPGKPTGDSSRTNTHWIYVAFAVLEGGRLYGPTGNAIYGSLKLTDSLLMNVGYMYLWYPTQDCFIERNIFMSFGGISVGHSGAVKVYVRNNLFYQPAATDFRNLFCVENWAAYDQTQTIVELNSFLATNCVAVSVESGYSSARLTAISNYWNTTNPTVIKGMIHDRASDTNCASFIPYIPFLVDHDISTPRVGQLTPSPPLLSVPALVGEQFQFILSAQAGYSYTVEFTSKLTAPTWQTLAVVPAPSVATNVVISDPVDASQRYYRVRTP